MGKVKFDGMTLSWRAPKSPIWSRNTDVRLWRDNGSWRVGLGCQTRLLSALSRARLWEEATDRVWWRGKDAAPKRLGAYASMLAVVRQVNAVLPLAERTWIEVERDPRGVVALRSRLRRKPKRRARR